MFCGSRRLKSRLPKAAGAEPSKEKFHTVDDDEDDHDHNDHDYNYTYNYSCNHNYTTTTTTTTNLHYITMHCTTLIILHSGTLHYKERVLGLDFAFWKKRSFVVTCGQLQVTQIIASGPLNPSVRQLCPVKHASTPLFL